LNSLREAKNNGGALIVMMQMKSAGEHLLFAQQIIDTQQQVVGVLVVALRSNKVASMLGDSFGQSGYVELQQGREGALLLANKGNIRWKQGTAMLAKKLPNSYWRLAYWPEKQASTHFPWISFVVALIIILLMGLLREAWQTYLMKRDITTLNKQLDDAEKGTLEKTYPLAFSAMNDLANNIQALGLKYFQAVSEKGATAESLWKKMDAIEQENKLADLDTVLDDSIDYDSDNI